MVRIKGYDLFTVNRTNKQGSGVEIKDEESKNILIIVFIELQAPI